jgi:hypothetical protein
VADSTGPEWWRTLPPAQTEIACGRTRHAIHWGNGSIALPAHGDAETEQVITALGGEEAECMAMAEVWARHADDLEVLSLGPRSAADEVPVSWDDVESAWSQPPVAYLRRPRSTPMRPAVPPSPRGIVRLSAGSSTARAVAVEDNWVRQVELLSLLALGPAFQVRLAATVAASWQDRAMAGHRPVLTAALTGRLAPVAQAWLGIDPARVMAYPHEGPGWGRLELTGSGPGAGLRASLPVGWLARVWACGLAVAGGHLVVAVQAARWPDARVLALPEPGASPVTLDVRASVNGAERSGLGAHWEVTDTSGQART